MDTNILLVLKDKALYDKYARFIKKSSLSEECYNIFTAMGEWWKYNPAVAEINWKAFASWFCLVRYAKMDKDKLDVYRALFDAMDSAPSPKEEDIKLLMEGLITRDYAAQISAVALRIEDGDFGSDFSTISELVDKRNAAIGKMGGFEKHVLLPTLEGLFSATAAGVKWRLDCLNEGLGDLRQGDLVIFGARPDTGKTTWLASEATHIAEQLLPEKHVLWINNEEEGNKVFSRIIQSTLGIKTATMEANIPKALEEYEKRMGRMDKIVMLNKADVNVKDVDALLEKYPVGLIIFDQLWKVHGFEAEAGSEVMRQTLLFNWAREKAKLHAPVLAVHQADGNAEGLKWIDMSKLYGSKTGIQGEADAIITMGRLPDTGNTRYLYLPKNKLKGGSDPASRNGRWEIEIEPDIARFKSY